MIRVSDITDAWLAAWSMAKGDPTWTERLDMSAPAVFRSFWALALAVPAFLVGLTAQRRVLLAQPETVQAQFLAAMPEPLYFGGLLGASLIIWGAELFLLVSVAQRREVGWKISPLIITANWVKCIYLSIASLATVVASITGILAIEGVVGMMALSLLLYLRWGIVRETMEFSPRGAVAMIGGLMVVYIGAAVLATILLAVLVVATGGEAFEAIANSV